MTLQQARLVMIRKLLYQVAKARLDGDLFRAIAYVQAASQLCK
jgi:hypothetical protein